MLVSLGRIHTVNPQQWALKSAYPQAWLQQTSTLCFKSLSSVLQWSLRYRYLQGLWVCCKEQRANTLLIGCVSRREFHKNYVKKFTGLGEGKGNSKTFGTMKQILSKLLPFFFFLPEFQSCFTMPLSVSRLPSAWNVEAVRKKGRFYRVLHSLIGCISTVQSAVSFFMR